MNMNVDNIKSASTGRKTRDAEFNVSNLQAMDAISEAPASVGPVTKKFFSGQVQELSVLPTSTQADLWGGFQYDPLKTREAIAAFTENGVFKPEKFDKFVRDTVGNGPIGAADIAKLAQAMGFIGKENSLSSGALGAIMASPLGDAIRAAGSNLSNIDVGMLVTNLQNMIGVPSLSSTATVATRLFNEENYVKFLSDGYAGVKTTQELLERFIKDKIELNQSDLENIRAVLGFNTVNEMIYSAGMSGEGYMSDGAGGYKVKTELFMQRLNDTIKSHAGADGSMSPGELKSWLDSSYLTTVLGDLSPAPTLPSGEITAENILALIKSVSPAGSDPNNISAYNLMFVAKALGFNTLKDMLAHPKIGGLINFGKGADGKSINNTDGTPGLINLDAKKFAEGMQSIIKSYADGGGVTLDTYKKMRDDNVNPITDVIKRVAGMIAGKTELNQSDLEEIMRALGFNTLDEFAYSDIGSALKLDPSARPSNKYSAKTADLMKGIKEGLQKAAGADGYMSPAEYKGWLSSWSLRDISTVTVHQPFGVVTADTISNYFKTYGGNNSTPSRLGGAQLALIARSLGFEHLEDMLSNPKIAQLLQGQTADGRPINDNGGAANFLNVDAESFAKGLAGIINDYGGGRPLTGVAYKNMIADKTPLPTR